MMSAYHDISSAYQSIYSQYVDVSSFLWLLRSIAVNRPNYSIGDVRNIEHRLDYQLDGIMSSLEMGWPVCEEALEIGEPGEVFTAAVIAIRSHDTGYIRTAVEAGLAKPEATPGLISAMGWLPEHLAAPWIEKFLNGKDMNHKYLGVSACSVRSSDPGEMLVTILKREDCRQHELLYARTLRLVGELRRQDLMPFVLQAMNADNESVKFWASWSAIMLGHKKAIEVIKPYLFKPGPHHLVAIQLAFRVLPIEMARTWISEMAKQKELERSVITATGVLGDPHAVNWLIAKMADPKLARVAGEAFSLMTGADLEQLQVTIPLPKGASNDPTDDPADANVSMDPDEDLPFPDMKKMTGLWQRYGQNFIVGQRYFLGRPISVDGLKERLMQGKQRQRHAAALELALVDSQSRLINTCARMIPQAG